MQIRALSSDYAQFVCTAGQTQFRGLLVFFEPLESRMLLSSATEPLSASTTPTVQLKIIPPANLLLPGPEPRDLIFDPKRHQVFAITQYNGLNYYDAAQGLLLGSWAQAYFKGADITKDSRFIYLADGGDLVTKLNLADFTSTDIGERNSSGLAASDDLAITPTDVIVSRRGYANTLDLVRGIHLQSDKLFDVQNGDSSFILPQYAIPARSYDYNYMILASADFIYSYQAEAIQSASNRGYGHISGVAVSRNGALHAVGTSTDVRIEDQQFNTVKELPFANAGVAFDPSRDRLYISDPVSDEIHAFDTASWDEVLTIPIGEDLPPVDPYQSGIMAVSDDQDALFLATPSGVRMYHTKAANAVFGNTIALQAAVDDADSSTLPTGQVQFFDTTTSTALGDAVLNDGIATLSFNTLHAGPHSIIAKYLGDQSFAAADSPAETITIDRAATRTYMVLSDLRKMTASVRSFDPLMPDGGTLTLYEGSTRLGSGQLRGGEAQVPFSLPYGYHNLSIKFSGTNDYLPSTFGPTRFTVQKFSKTTLTSSATTIQYGQGVTLSMSVTDASLIERGSMSLHDYKEWLGYKFVDSSGRARWTFRDLNVGTHRITAQFSGVGLLGSSTSKPVLIKVAPQSMHITLTAARTPALGQNVPITAKVTGFKGSPLDFGHLTFKEGTTFLATTDIYQGKASYVLHNPSAGSHTITAIYSGDQTHAASTATTKMQVIPGQTKVNLTTEATYLPAGEIFRAVASVSVPGVISDLTRGKVVFRDNGRIISTARLGNSGAVALSTSSLGAGDHTITATYLGTSEFKSSVSSSIKVTIVPATTVDLLVLYTSDAQYDARSEIYPYASEIDWRIGNAVTDTNEAFWRSHIPVKLRLVHSALTDYNESGQLKTDLKRLASAGDGYLDDVQALRDQYHADLVSLIVANGDLGGLSYELRDVHAKNNADLGFSVAVYQQIDSPTYTLAHELGHNFGATHDAEHYEGKGATTFSNGWRFTGDDGVLYHDIMSYDPGETIPYFSNPRIKYQGVPTGHVVLADSARTITLTAPYVASYRRRR